MGNIPEIPLRHPVICVVGPTASGKTDLAQELALAYNGEVVSADSMQLYRGMDIGTGKLKEADRKVAHFGIDVLDPSEPWSAALFQDYARSCFQDIDARGKRSILCGGTGFYVRAAIDAYDFPKGEQVDNPIRAKYAALAEGEGAENLWKLLEEADPDSAALIHANDVKRVIRAFELLDSGTSYSKMHEKLGQIPQAVPAVFLGLEVDPCILNGRIAERVDRMIEEGLVEEVQSLLDGGFREQITAPQAIGYKEIVEYIDGKRTLEDAVKQIKTATRRYAKRQRTWFRNDQRIQWLHADSGDTSEMLLQAAELLDKMEEYNLKEQC